MARSNYKFKKRQKELARKKKKEEKRQAKLDKKNTDPEGEQDQPRDDSAPLQTDDTIFEN